MRYHGLNIPGMEIAEFCRRHRIRRLALFGSILRQDFGSDSDIDVLVEFEPDGTPGFAFFGMQKELSGILGRKADLNTAAELSPNFRQEVVGEAAVLYDAA